MRNINRSKVDRKVTYFVGNKNSFITYLKWNLSNNKRRNILFPGPKCPDFNMYLHYRQL